MPTDLDKVRKLLPHWMEHNAEHAGEFREWAERARQAGAPEAADHILQAAAAMEQSNQHLKAALAGLG
jgi:hypothetical protein